MKRKILITGGDGFIGRNLREYLSKYYEIISPSHKELELLEDEQVFRFLKKNKFDTVIHTATHNATRTSTKDVNKVFFSNIKMFINLARCNKFYKRMFYFGSGAEYDMCHYLPKMKEEYFGHHVPNDDYGFSKYIMAQYIKNTPNIYDLRLFGCFGKYEDWRIRFISNACCFAMYDLDFIMNQNVYFDYLYIDDLMKIVMKFIEIKHIPYQHYNICTGKTVDLISLAKMIIKISNNKIKMHIKKVGLKKEYSGNNSRLLKTIGSYNFTPIEVAVKELYNWYNSRKNLIDKKLLKLKYTQ